MIRVYTRVVWLCTVAFLLFIIGFVIYLFNIQNPDIKNKKKHVALADTVSIDPTKLYLVTDVIDGDTIKVRIDEKRITIRLLGVNTPEVLDPRKSAECYGKESSAETKKLLSGREVRISLNPNYEHVDKYDRLLAYIWLKNDLNGNSRATTSEIFINDYLIKEGFGREYTFNKNKPYQYQKLFSSDESEAQRLDKGLWKNCK